jgi:membrane protein YqaA with SNARE-associated domain
MADYWSLAVSVFVVNIVPMFMPPTWFFLAYAKLKDPALDPLALAVVGAVASTLGRGVLTFYSAFFRRFFTKDLASRADGIKAILEKKHSMLFLGTFAYSLTPFPSNVLFIARGLTKVDSKPVFSGFFVGRLISYYTMVVLSQDFSGMLQQYLQSEVMVRYAFDVIGIVGAFSIILIDWKKVMDAAKARTQPGRQA